MCERERVIKFQLGMPIIVQTCCFLKDEVESDVSNSLVEKNDLQPHLWLYNSDLHFTFRRFETGNFETNKYSIIKFKFIAFCSLIIILFPISDVTQEKEIDNSFWEANDNYSSIYTFVEFKRISFQEEHILNHNYVEKIL